MSGIIRRDYVPLTKAAAGAADAILTVSETTRDEVLELLRVPRDRVHVTYNGGSESYAPVPAADRIVADRFGIERPFVLFAGRREYRKDLPTLLAACGPLLERQPDLALVLAGPDGDSWDTTWAGADPAVRGRTHVLEHQSQQSLAELYSAARVLVLPSRWEGFGLTGIEAMACGTPVVAARSGAMPEIYGDAARWFPAGDAEALTEALDAVLTDTALRAELVAVGRDRARLYTWDTTADLTHRVYEDVAG
jgi:glycosyltransferase involved in cell wall biosynthesis